MSQQPLSGRRVSELGTRVAAPFATHILSQMGAEVIKVEPPSGDTTRALVRGGPSGTLIAIGSSCNWALSSLSLPVVDVTAAADAKEFSCPGSVLRTVPETHAFTQGLSESVAVFGAAPKAFRVMTDKEREAAHASAGEVEALLRYAPARTLISGYIAKPEIIAGQAAWVPSPAWNTTISTISVAARLAAKAVASA